MATGLETTLTSSRTIPSIGKTPTTMGLGDNLGNARIAMHRIESEPTTFNLFGGLGEVSTYNLGDFDRTGGSKWLIQGGSPQRS